MYTFDSRVRYSETAENGQISVPALIDYMQDCTNFQSEDLGVGLEYHKKLGLMWVLNSWQIIIEQYPKMGQKITIGTQSYGYEKMFGYRNFLITDASGACVAKANSNWVLMDVKKGRPMLVTPEIGDVYGKAEPLLMEYAPRKIKVPENGREQEGLVVREYHLDTNHHVNNGQYVDMALELLPDDFVIKQMRAEYKQQAFLDDVLYPYVIKNENQYVISLMDDKGRPYVVVEFLGREG